MLEPGLRAQLSKLQAEGYEDWSKFDLEVRRRDWHPFMPANYDNVLRCLIGLRSPGLRFLEWGSANGVITIMADLLGFDACGIEIDGRLVDTARELASRFSSRARFATGSFLPDGYSWRSESGDHRLGTIGYAKAGYEELGIDLEEFDIVFGYPWSGEEPVMHDLMVRRGREDALLLVNTTAGVEIHSRGARLR
jgi:hypothetical protein